MLSSPQPTVIRIMCPNLACQRVLSVPIRARGKVVRCRGCGMNVRVPAQKTSEPQPESDNQAA